jgi:hypothetical protein
VTFVDLQLFGSVEFPDPPDEPEVVEAPPQPAKANANPTEAARAMPRASAELRSLKLISALTIGFREFGKVGSGEEICESLGEFSASFCWAQCSVGRLDAQQDRDGSLRILRQQIARGGMAIDQPKVRALC